VLVTSRIKIHRQLGWVLAALGVAMILSSLQVTLNFVPRQRVSGNDIESRLLFYSLVVWAYLAALLAFSILLGFSVTLRRRAALHKRLMLLASISMGNPQ
jgi:uncharacterized membrane protein YozB (DUF420 family)